MSETIAPRRSAVGFVAPDRPPLARAARLVRRAEGVMIDAPFADVVARIDATPLSVRHPPAAGLPGVVDTAPLTLSGFGPVGGRHLVFLSDDTTVVEEVVENTRTD